MSAIVLGDPDRCARHPDAVLDDGHCPRCCAGDVPSDLDRLLDERATLLVRLADLNDEINAIRSEDRLTKTDGGVRE